LSEVHRRPVIDIYNHYVDHGFASYREVRVPDQAFDRFLALAEGYPAYAVVQDTGAVVGFGFLHAWHPSECFRTTAEVTYFLHPAATRQGIGSRLLSRLLDEAKAQNFERILASISSRNPESLAFHRQQGFELCGRFPQVGCKRGTAFDVIWMMKVL
jgi:phosphinothricin acetyltransferase